MNKAEVHQILLDIVVQKKKDLEKLIIDIRNSNNETKSSMGDKYETSREMIQQEINRLLTQLKVIEQQLSILKETSVKESQKVEKGCIVETENGYFYIAVSVGKFEFKEKVIFGISLESPLAKAMMDKKKGEMFILNNRVQLVKNIW